MLIFLQKHNISETGSVSVTMHEDDGLKSKPSEPASIHVIDLSFVTSCLPLYLEYTRYIEFQSTCLGGRTPLPWMLSLEG